MSQLDSANMSDTILNQLYKMNLDVKSSLIGMGFDDASVTNGKCTGVQAHIREVAPTAYYVHCYGHRLSLVLVDAIGDVPEAADFFTLLEQLYIFISGATVHAKFIELQNEVHTHTHTHKHTRMQHAHTHARMHTCTSTHVRGLQFILFEIITTLDITDEIPCESDIDLTQHFTDVTQCEHHIVPDEVDELNVDEVIPCENVANYIDVALCLY